MGKDRSLKRRMSNVLNCRLGVQKVDLLNLKRKCSFGLNLESTK